MTSTEQRNSSAKSIEELRDLDDSSTWQALVDREERCKRNTPKVIPPCPTWCRYEAGHPYDSVEHDEVTFSRIHASGRDDDGNVAIVQPESNHGGVVSLDAPTISLYGDNEMFELDAAGARGRAAELLAAADQLEQITRTSGPAL